MTAYMIIEAEIHDPARFGEYARAVMPLVAEYGGEYLVLGGRQLPLEGAFGEARYVLSRWPSGAAAQAFWDSASYARVRKLRESTGVFRVILVEGLPSGVGAT